MNFDNLNAIEREEISRKKLKDIIPFFLNNNFYKEKLNGFDFDNFKLKDFEKIPFTTKNELKNSSAFQRSTVARKDIAYFFSSSGTTGHPTVYVWTKKDNEILNIVAKRAMDRVGVKDEDLALILAPFGMPIMWYCMMSQYATLNAGVIPLGIANPNYILDTIKEFSPTIVTTIPNSILSLHEYKEQRYMSEITQAIKQFHVGGDFLSDARRKRIESKWNADCFDFYGISEIMGPIAGECKNKNGMHFASDYIYIEVLNPISKEKVENGETGIAVYTTLWEKGAPLLRYWSDDYVSLINDTCSCGCTFPKIHYKGRTSDSFLFNGHRFFAKEIEDELFKFDYVGNEWQLEIKSENTKSRIQLTLETKNDNANYLNILKNNLSEFFNDKIEIKCVPIGNFPRTNIKPQRIINHNE